MIGTENNGMYMPVAPLYMGGCNNGFGNGNDWGDWLVLLILFGCFNGGWGGFGGGNNQLGYDFPWLMNANNRTIDAVTTGFDNSAVMSQLGDINGAITSGFANLNTGLCSGFAGINANITGAQNSLSQQLYTNQISDLNRSFAEQTANTQGFMNLQGQLAQASADNRLATCQTTNAIINDGNATRTADANNTRDIIESNTRGTQAILDKLCQLELDGYKRENDNLRSQLNEANRAASQAAQNTLITQGFANEVDALYNRLNSCPVPSTPVYGKTPIFTCGNGTYAGCGCAAMA